MEPPEMRRRPASSDNDSTIKEDGDTGHIIRFVAAITKVFHNMYDSALCRKFVEIDTVFGLGRVVLLTLTNYICMLAATIILERDTRIDYTRAIEIILTVCYALINVWTVIQLVFEVNFIRNYKHRYREEAQLHSATTNHWLHSMFMNHITPLRSLMRGPVVEGALAIAATAIRLVVFIVLYCFIVVDFSGVYESRRQVNTEVLTLIGIFIAVATVYGAFRLHANWRITRDKEGSFTTLAKHMVNRSSVAPGSNVKGDLTPDTLKDETEAVQVAFKNIFKTTPSEYVSDRVVSELTKHVHEGLNATVRSMMARRDKAIGPFSMTAETSGKDLDDVNRASAAYVYEKFALVPYHNRITSFLITVDVFTTCINILLACQHLSGWSNHNSTLILVLMYVIYIFVISIVVLVLWISIRNLRKGFCDTQINLQQFTQETIIQSMSDYFRSYNRKTTMPSDKRSRTVQPNAIERYHKRTFMFKLPQDVSNPLLVGFSILIFSLVLLGVFSVNCAVDREGIHVMKWLDWCFRSRIYSFGTILFMSVFVIMCIYAVCAYVLKTYGSSHTFVISSLDELVQNAKKYNLTRAETNILLAHLLTTGKPEMNGLNKKHTMKQTMRSIDEMGIADRHHVVISPHSSIQLMSRNATAQMNESVTNRLRRNPKTVTEKTGQLHAHIIDSYVDGQRIADLSNNDDDDTLAAIQQQQQEQETRV